MYDWNHLTVETCCHKINLKKQTKTMMTGMTGMKVDYNLLHVQIVYYYSVSIVQLYSPIETRNNHILRSEQSNLN